MSVNLESFYRTPAWLAVRYEALKRHGAACQCCGVLGTPGNPIQVDHIKPISRAPHLGLTLENLQVLCWQCNQGKGARDHKDWRGHAGYRPQTELEEAFKRRAESMYSVVRRATRFFRINAEKHAQVGPVHPDIGWAPDECFALKEALGSEGISVEEMIEVGLLISGEDVPVPYDRFRNCSVFFLRNERHIVGFGFSPGVPAVDTPLSAAISA